jgi:hypothetical protein
MNEPSVIHIVGVTAVWIIFLSAIRFGLVGVAGMKPIVSCLFHIMRARHATWRDRGVWFTASLDRQYQELIIALTTRWSGVLLFGGIAMLGWGLFWGSIGDVAQLVSRAPKSWDGFDRGSDLAGAVLLALGMSSIHAAVTRKRSLSLWVSIGFAIMGVGIGAVTAVRP